MSSESFGVAVVTCNRLNLLKECVDAINGQTVPFQKVVIVNNNSNDGTKQFLDEIEDKRYQIVHSAQNLGGAGGFSLALEQFCDMTTDWVLIIDDDAIIRKSFIEEIDNQIQNFNGKYLAYSGVVLEEGKPNILHRKEVVKNDVLGVPVPLEQYDKETFECGVASFCGLLIHTSLLKKIGLPKKEYFIWHDDTEYSLRINSISKILNVNTAVLDHKRKPGASDIHDWKNYYGFRNELDLFRRYSKCQYYKEILKMKVRLFKAKKNKDFRLAEIYSAVLKDNAKHRLGINEEFLPK